MGGKSFGGTRPAAPSAASVGGGAAASTEADFVVQFSDAVNSAISSRTGMVQLSVTGIAGFDYATGKVPLSDDQAAEATEDAPQFSAPGIVGRPLPPQNVRGVDLRMNVMCLRTSDGLVPFAYRDLRWTMGGSGPGAGMLAFVGYGGGFFSQSAVAAGNNPAGGGTLQVIYCPFARNADGVPQKAHAIILDPTAGNESVQMMHANGLAITMSDQGKKALLMKNAAGDATFRLDDDGVTITAQRIVLSGGVIVGEPASAVPLLPGAASPGSSKLWVSP